jgi:hypothetical protein
MQPLLVPAARQQRPMVSPPQRIISSRKTLQRTIQTQLNIPSDNRLRFTANAEKTCRLQRVKADTANDAPVPTLTTHRQ